MSLERAGMALAGGYFGLEAIQPPAGDGVKAQFSVRPAPGLPSDL